MKLEIESLAKRILEPPVPPARKILFSIYMAADYLGVSPSYLRKKVKNNSIKFKQPEGKHGNIYFKKEWLDEWTNERDN